MPRYLIAAAAAALSAPAVAQPADPLEEDIRRAIPPAEQVKAMAPALDVQRL